MQFPTAAVLTASTGILLCPIGEAYAVASFVMGSEAYTHDLARLGPGDIGRAIRLVCPELPADVNGDAIAFRDAWIAKCGETFDLPDALRDVLADDSHPAERLKKMAPNANVISI
jgi:hypothetical protein